MINKYTGQMYVYTLTVKSWMDWALLDWLAIEWSDLILTKRCVFEELGLNLMQESRTLVEIGLEIEGFWRKLKRVFLEAKIKDFEGEERVFWVRNLAEEQSMVGYWIGFSRFYLYRGWTQTEVYWYVSRDAEVCECRGWRYFGKRGRWKSRHELRRVWMWCVVTRVCDYNFQLDIYLFFEVISIETQDKAHTNDLNKW